MPAETICTAVIVICTAVKPGWRIVKARWHGAGVIRRAAKLIWRIAEVSLRAAKPIWRTAKVICAACKIGWRAAENLVCFAELHLTASLQAYTASGGTQRSSKALCNTLTGSE
ncbi:MAG: hypothetical protein WBV94_07530 [Blastocatellia bacterium]